ncbi:MAG: response regulator [Candidatus Sedimenticola endophacoides]
MVRVLLVDDHELVRTGIRHLLDSNPQVEVVGEATSGEEAITMARELLPDLVLMDVSMPGIGGIEATRRIRQRYEQIRVIALTVHCDAPFPEKLYEAGASGYITKGCPADELFDAIRQVSAGEPFVSADVSRKMTLQRIAGVEPDSPFGSLSQREMQVLLMITQGLKNQDISDSLCLSPKTISTYRHRLSEKLGVETDVDLTHMALRYGLISTKG